MSDGSRILVLAVEVERLRQENDRLRAENSALRPLVSSLRHNLAIQCNHCDYLPHDLKTGRGKRRADATERTQNHG